MTLENALGVGILFTKSPLANCTTSVLENRGCYVGLENKPASQIDTSDFAGLTSQNWLARDALSSDLLGDCVSLTPVL